MTKETKLQHSARYQAMESLTRWRKEEGYINEEVDRTLHSSAVSDQDQALYTRLVYGSVQYHYTLDQMLKQLIKKPKGVKDWLWELLLLSLYQMYYLDHIPDHAIVNEANKIVKKRAGQRLTGFSNAVLRNARRTYPDIEAFIQEKSEDKAQALSLKGSLPLKWTNYFIQRFGLEETEKLVDSIGLPSHLVIRLSRRAWPREEEVIQSLEEEGYQLQASPLAAHSYRVQGGNPAASDAFKDGLITIQDEAASLAVPALDIRPGMEALDCCAAPGGKTLQIAEDLEEDGCVLALDIAKAKLKKIQNNVQRLKLSDRVRVRQADASRMASELAPESFDRILVDAPCSGLGLIRRKPDIKYRKSLADLESLSQIQLEILRQAYPLLKKGGKMVYSTCTITEEENSLLVQRFLSEHEDLKVIPLDGVFPHLRESVREDGTLEILPESYGSDGFYIAAFQKD